MNGLWKIVVGAVVLLALGGAATGFVLAQDAGDEEAASADRPDFVGLLAGNLGIAQEELEAAVKQTKLDLVDEALAAGRIDEEQAAQMRERIESGEKARPGHKFGHRGGGHDGAEVAEFLGITQEEIAEARQDGQSLAQIAEANGVSADELAAFLLGKIEERLSQAVEDGKIDQARADEVLANASDRIDEMINREGPPDGEGKHRGGRFGGFPGGMGRFQPQGEAGPF